MRLRKAGVEQVQGLPVPAQGFERETHEPDDCLVEAALDMCLETRMQIMRQRDLYELECPTWQLAVDPHDMPIAIGRVVGDGRGRQDVFVGRFTGVLPRFHVTPDVATPQDCLETSPITSCFSNPIVASKSDRQQTQATDAEKKAENPKGLSPPNKIGFAFDCLKSFGNDCVPAIIERGVESPCVDLPCAADPPG